MPVFRPLFLSVFFLTKHTHVRIPTCPNIGKYLSTRFQMFVFHQNQKLVGAEERDVQEILGFRVHYGAPPCLIHWVCKVASGEMGIGCRSR